MKQAIVSSLPILTAGGVIPTKEIVAGVEMPVVSIGTALWSTENKQNIVGNWLAQGFRGVDTAWQYFDQKDVAKSIQDSGAERKDVFITTKIPDCDYLATPALIDYDLSRLNTSYIDLLLIHYPIGSCPRTWTVLEKYVEQGKLRAIGVSNFDTKHLQDIMKIASVPIAVNQIEYNVFRHNEDTIAFCDANNITVEAWSPLNGIPGGKSVFQDSTVKAIAGAHNISAAQVALKWIVQRGHVLAVLSGNPEHQANDADLFSFELSDEEMTRLAGIASSIDVDIKSKPKHMEITVVDLCDDEAKPCSAVDHTFSFPVTSVTPTYSWNTSLVLLEDAISPNYDVSVKFHENLPIPWPEIPLGHNSGAACGEVVVKFGIGSKGAFTPLPCPGCHIALQFPPCSDGWKKGAAFSFLGEFKMGFFYMGAPPIDPTPNITVTVSVRDDDGLIFSVSALHKPVYDEPEAVIV